jgi:glycosyltransferase involved in cell wall biosynthesis
MVRLSIIVPAFNESKTIAELLRRILNVPFAVPYEIVIVDDCSKDGVSSVVENLIREYGSDKIRLMRNETNQGKGFSVVRGFQSAAGEIVVVQDADFEYDPSELPRLLRPLLEGQTEVVYGSRFLREGRPQGMALPNYLANVVLTWFTNVLFGIHITDMETCYKLVKKDLALSLNLSAKRFDFEPEITAKLAKRHKKIMEFPISYQGRTVGEGKKIKARDFFIAIMVLLKHRFSANG